MVFDKAIFLEQMRAFRFDHFAVDLDLGNFQLFGEFEANHFLLTIGANARLYAELDEF